MTIRKGSTVKLVYKGMLPDGTVYDQATADAPLEFPAGKGLTLDGFEREVMEMEAGEKKTFTVKDHDAFGEYHEDWTETVPLHMIPNGHKLHVGKVIYMLDENGAKVPNTVLEISEGNVLIDCNHPLAGKDLTFEVEILEIDESTAMTDKELKLEEAKKKYFDAGGPLSEVGMGASGGEVKL